MSEIILPKPDKTTTHVVSYAAAATKVKLTITKGKGTAEFTTTAGVLPIVNLEPAPPPQSGKPSSGNGTNVDTEKTFVIKIVITGTGMMNRFDLFETL